MTKNIIDAVNELKGDLSNSARADCSKYLKYSLVTGAWLCSRSSIANHSYDDVCTTEEFLATVAECETNFGRWSQIAIQAWKDGDKTLLTKDLDKELDMDIDWSKAPDDCVGAVESNDPYATYPFGMFVKKYDGFNGYKYCHEQEAYPCMEAFTFISRPQPTPIYTKEMADNGVFPSVGMECLINDSVYDEEYYIAIISFVGISNIVWTHGGAEYSQASSDLTFKPLTPPITLIDGECYQFNSPSGGLFKGYYIPVKGLFVAHKGSFDAHLCTNIVELTPKD
jgi:hypothetical protein